MRRKCKVKLLYFTDNKNYPNRSTNKIIMIFFLADSCLGILPESLWDLRQGHAQTLMGIYKLNGQSLIEHAQNASY